METIKTLNRCIIAFAIMILCFQFVSCDVFWPGSYLETLSVNGMQSSLQKVIKYSSEMAISRHDIIGLAADDESLFVVQIDKIQVFKQSDLSFVKTYTYNSGATLNPQNVHVSYKHLGSTTGNDYEAINLTKFTDGSLCLSPVQTQTQPYLVYTYEGDPTGELITTQPKAYSIVLKNDGTADVTDQNPNPNRFFDVDELSYIEYFTNYVSLSTFTYQYSSSFSMRITPVFNFASDSLLTGSNARPYGNSNVALLLNRYPISALRMSNSQEPDSTETPFPLGYNNMYGNTIKAAVGIAGSAIWDSYAASFFDTASNYVGTCQLLPNNGNGIAMQGCAVGKDSLFVIVTNNDPSGTTSVDNRNNSICIYKYNWGQK